MMGFFFSSFLFVDPGWKEFHLLRGLDCSEASEGPVTNSGADLAAGC